MLLDVWWEMFACLDGNADHVDDLHEREAEGELQRVALVDDGPL